MEEGKTSKCNVCGVTGQQGKPLMRCSRCKAVHYCSKEHQLKDWKDGHKLSCQPAPEPGKTTQPQPTVRSTYDIGQVGNASKDPARELKMLTKEDVTTTDGGWWLMPSITSAEGEGDATFLKEKFDTSSYNTRHIPLSAVTTCPHCDKECKEGIFAVQIMLKKKGEDNSLVYLRPFPRLFHKDCTQDIFGARGTRYPIEKCHSTLTLKDAWEVAWPDIDELQATLAVHDEGFQAETRETKKEEGK